MYSSYPRLVLTGPLCGVRRRTARPALPVPAARRDQKKKRRTRGSMRAARRASCRVPDRKGSARRRSKRASAQRRSSGTPAFCATGGPAVRGAVAAGCGRRRQLSAANVREGCRGAPDAGRGRGDRGRQASRGRRFGLSKSWRANEGGFAAGRRGRPGSPASPPRVMRSC